MKPNNKFTTLNSNKLTRNISSVHSTHKKAQYYSIFKKKKKKIYKAA